MAIAVKISTLHLEENHYLNREVDELDEQKVNFKSQPNKEKSYLCILPVRIHKQLKFEGFRRISKDLRGFYSISTASFVVWIDFSAHNYLETFQDLRLGFLKRPYLQRSVKMATRGDPLKVRQPITKNHYK